MVQAFRGVGKSWLTVAYVAWRLRKNPDMNITVVSASQQKATDFTTFLLRLINDVPCLQHLRPSAEQRCSKISFDVGPARAQKDPSVSSLGITGQLTGGRADLIIPDDVEVPGNSETQKMREKLAEKIKEFDAMIKPGGEIVFLGTPQSQSSIYKLLPARGYTIRIWPSEYPGEEQIEKYAGRLAPQIQYHLSKDQSLVGHTTDPERFSDTDLAERKASYGRAGYALQFMLNTNLSDADRFPLHLSDLLVYPVDNDNGPEKLMWAGSPENVITDLPVVGIDGDKLHRPVIMEKLSFFPWSGKVMAIDPSGRGKDETSYAVAFSLNGYVHIPDAGGLKGYELPTLERLAEIAKKYKVSHIIVEPNFGDGMFTRLFQPVLQKIYQCKLEETPRHSVQKEKRIIDTLEPVMSSHRLVIDPRLIQRDFESTQRYEIENHHWYQLFYQMTNITREKGCLAHDDRIDVLSMAVGYFAQALGIDTDDAIQRLKDKDLEEELERYHNHVFGADNHMQDRWIQRVG
jgi:hypothetical protein